MARALLERPPADVAAPAGRSGAPSFRHAVGLDGIRALAVAAVFAYHIGTTGGGVTLRGGFIGVDVFFVLSGYLITSLLIVEFRGTRRISIGQFYLRRARRLLPALFALLLTVGVIGAFWLPQMAARLRGDLVAALAYATNWWLIVQNSSYFGAGGDRPDLLTHLWSLAVEEQYYLIWPLLLIIFAVLRASRTAMLVSIMAGVVASTVVGAVLYDPFSDPSRVYYGTDTRALAPLLGSALAILAQPWMHRRSPGIGRRFAVDLVGLAGLAGLALVTLTLDDKNPLLYEGGFLVVAALGAMLVGAAGHPASLLGRLLGLQPLRWLGERSYAIYLWHWPICVLTRPGIDVGLTGWADTVLRVAIVLVLAELSYWLIERPIRQHGFLGRLRRPAPAHAALPGRAATPGRAAVPRHPIVAEPMIATAGGALGATRAFERPGTFAQWSAPASPGLMTSRGSTSAGAAGAVTGAGIMEAGTGGAVTAGAGTAGAGTSGAGDGWPGPRLPRAGRVPAPREPVGGTTAYLGRKRRPARIAPLRIVLLGLLLVGGGSVVAVQLASDVAHVPVTGGPADTAPDVALGRLPTASATPTPTPSASGPTPLTPLPRGAKVAFFGDSQGMTLLLNRPSDLGRYINALDETIEGCGILVGKVASRSGEKRNLTADCRNWQSVWADRVGKVKPDVAVVMIGAWDVFDLTLDSGTLAFGSPGWDANYLTQLDAGVQTLRSSGAQVELALLPCYRPVPRSAGFWPERGDDARTRHVNDLLRQEATRFPDDVHTLEPPVQFCTNPTIAKSLSYRWDGVHYYKPGAALYFKAILPQLVRV